jgi:hypothetical protein
MKRKPDVNEELKQALDESLPDEMVAASLARTLGEVRRKRRRRQGVTLAGVACVVGLGVLAWIQSGTAKVPVMAGADPVERMESSPPIRMQEISDAELLAMFPGRAAGFATVNGHREFILLPPEGAAAE